MIWQTLNTEQFQKLQSSHCNTWSFWISWRVYINIWKIWTLFLICHKYGWPHQMIYYILVKYPSFIHFICKGAIFTFSYPLKLSKFILLHPKQRRNRYFRHCEFMIFANICTNKSSRELLEYWRTSCTFQNMLNLYLEQIHLHLLWHSAFVNVVIVSKIITENSNETINPMKL